MSGGGINPKDAAIAVAVLAGLYVGYRALKGLGSAGDAVGGAVSSVVDGAGRAAGAVGDAVAGGWNWVTGFFSSDPETSVFGDDAMRRITSGMDWSLGPYVSQQPTITPGKGGTFQTGTVSGGSILDRGTFDQARKW